MRSTPRVPNIEIEKKILRAELVEVYNTAILGLDLLFEGACSGSAEAFAEMKKAANLLIFAAGSEKGK